VRCLVSQTRHSNVFVFLLSRALGPPTPLSILVRASLRCSVKGVVLSVVRDLRFLGNFLTWSSLHFSVADNGPLYAYVDIPFSRFRLQ
jgi:hypothetical protein